MRTRVFLLALIATLTATSGISHADEPKPPNIVFILADDKDYDFVRLPRIEPINEPRA